MNEAARHKKELLIREYGSNIAKIVDSIKTDSNKEERTRKSKLLIKLIEKMNPSVKYAENSEEILWGHLFILSDMELDVSVDFKKPDVEITSPEKINYPVAKPKYRHYGKNVEILGEKLSKLSDEEDKKEAAISYGKLLKTLYSSWNNNSVDDSYIVKNIEDFTNKNLTYDISLLSEDGKNSPFYIQKKSMSNNRSNHKNGKNGSGKNRNNNQRNKNNNRNK